MTTGHDLDNLYSFEDPLGSSFETSTFGLSSWQRYDDDSDSDWSDDDDDDQDDIDWQFASKPKSVPREPPQSQQPPAASSAAPKSGASCPCVVRSIRVRFNDHLDVRSYERAAPELFGVLFYSCHELQKMIDEAKNEKETKTA